MYNHGRLVEYLSESGFERSLVHYSNSLATTVCMITAGIGIAVLPPSSSRTNCATARCAC